MKIPPPENTNLYPSPPRRGQSDPLVEIWESRRQEAQDMRADWIAMQQKIQQWKQRILLSRLEFFWKVMATHTGFLAETWRPKN